MKKIILTAMNKFISSDTSNEVELTISPQLEDTFKEVFEIEMLQGERYVLQDGCLHFKMTLTPEKIEATKQAFIRAIFKTHKIKLN